MGFSSGKSKAKRKAQKAAAAEYYKAFAKVEPLQEISRVSTKNTREIEDSLGNDTSFRTRYAAKKIDRMAREINNDDDYKEKVSAYNDRYQILKDQIANKSSTRYTVGSKASQPAQSSNQNSIGMGGITGMFANQTPAPKTQSSFAAGAQIYKTKDEALGDATKKMEEYNNGLSKLIGTNKPQSSNNGGGMASYITSSFNNGSYNKADVDAMRINDPSRFINEEKFDGFGVLYRNLNVAESAAKDINALSKNFNDSAGYKNIEMYSALAEMLKPLIKKDAKQETVLAGEQSLVSSDLASANPYTETIK